MRYDEFRDQLEAALRRMVFTSMASNVSRPSSSRTLCGIGRSVPTEPHLRAPSPSTSRLRSASRGAPSTLLDRTRAKKTSSRSHWQEEATARTERRWTRVDLWLHARLPYGSTTAMPEPQLFGAWTASILEKIHGAFAEVEEKEGRIVAVLGAHGDVDVLAHCQPDGVVSLKGLAISGFRIVHLPRVWDDPDRRKAEKDPHAELDRVARTFKATLDEWTKSVSELAAWIRYSPPVAGAKPVEPWFEDLREDDDNDGGPETIN